jgi:hypothetical protein
MQKLLFVENLTNPSKNTCTVHCLLLPSHPIIPNLHIILSSNDTILSINNLQIDFQSDGEPSIRLLIRSVWILRKVKPLGL